VAGERGEQAVLNKVMNFRFAENERNFLNGSGNIGFSKCTILHVVSWLVS